MLVAVSLLIFKFSSVNIGINMYKTVFHILILSFVTKLTICNERPVIGILTQEVYWSRLNSLKPSNYSYIAASYVKAIEASGGRVVPVFTNRTTEYYKDVVKKVNGILVPGGGSAFNISFGISQSTNEIFHISKQINDDGDHFPILGICLGFELLLIASIDGKNPLTRCYAHDMNLPLNLIPTMEEKSVLFKTMPKDVRNVLLTEPVTANHHSFLDDIHKCTIWLSVKKSVLQKYSFFNLGQKVRNN